MSKLVRLVLAVLLCSLFVRPVWATHGDFTVTRSPGGTVLAGAEIRVTANVINTSTTEELSGAAVTSSFPDPNLRFFAGTVSTRYAESDEPAGTIVAGNALGDTNLHVELDPVPAGWTAQVVFRVRVPPYLPAGVEEASARLFLSYAHGAFVTIPWDVIVPIAASPVLVLDKSDGGATVPPGGTVVYRLRAENVGSQGATGLVLSDTVPLGGRFVAGGSSAGWSCSNGGLAGGLCALEFASLSAGESRTFDFAVRADGAPVPAGRNVLRNVAELRDDGSNSHQVERASAEEETPLVAAPDLRLAKRDGGVTVEAGEVVVYTLSYENAGDQDATGVVLEETVPFHGDFEAGASSGGWSCSGSSSGSVCSLAVGELAAGASAEAVFAVRVAPVLTAGVEEIVNRASVRDDGANGADPVPGDNVADERTPVEAAPDLSVVKSAGSDVVRPGEVLVYTLSYANEGTQTATGVALREVVPEHGVFVPGASDPEWSCAGGGVAGSVCTRLVGNLAPGDNGSVAFAVRVDEVLPAGVEEVVNSATIFDDGANGPDPDPSDDEDEVVTPVDAAPDLAVTKVGPAGSVRPGEVVVYTIRYQNLGDQGATGVELEETVPELGEFVPGASSDGWTCGPVAVAVGSASASLAGKLKAERIQSKLKAERIQEKAGHFSTCRLVVGDLAAGRSGEVVFAVRLDETLPAGVEEVVNRVRVGDDGGNGPDPVPGNDEDEVMTPVEAAPDLAVTKSADASVARPGEVVVYTIRYENLGSQGATGVVLEETVPVFAALEASSAGWSCGALPLAGRGLKVLAGKLKAERIQSKLKAERIQAKGYSLTTCTLVVGDLPAGASGEVEFAVRLDDAVPPGVEELVNRVRVGDDGANGVDPEPGNDEAVVTTPLDAAPDLGVVKDDGGVTAEPGGLVVYTLAYRNRGDQGASGVVLEETVPAHVRFAPGESEAGWACDLGVEPGAVCSWEVGELVPGQEGAVRFAVVVDGELPEGVERVVNRAVIRDDGASGPDRRPEDDESVVETPVGDDDPDPDPDPDPEPSPELDVFMADLLAEDRDESGSFSAGDVVTYSVEIRNVGDGVAEGVRFRVPVPEHTEYVPGSAYADALEVAAISGGVLEVSLGDLGAGEKLGMVWDVVIDPELAEGVSEVRAQGSVEAVGLVAHPSDDPATVERDDPTVTELGTAVGPGDPHDIPTVSEWGLMLLGLFLGVAAWRVLA